jgi:phosphoribosylaminoimidazolecarboxamide formyltransferase/IMP cyclohydrolase
LQRALLSVSDKTGVVDFARGLVELSVALIASGGTARALREAGLSVRTVEEVTGFPEMLGGRVKTLHPAIHAGILAKRDPGSLAELDAHDIETIDLVVVNLYPFQRTVARPDVSLDEAIENIDIGGVALLRAAAKNFEAVTVVVDPTDYATVLNELQTQGNTSPALRRRLALKAFSHTAEYDAAIGQYLATQVSDDGLFPERLPLILSKVQELRYGENPHQRGALYRLTEHGGLANAIQRHGKDMSYTNWLDLDAAWAVASDFSKPTCAIIKHTNPCGVASADSLAQAYLDAFAGDPVSAYGSVVGLNMAVDEATADAMASNFIEAIIAPGYTPAAFDLLAQHKNIRIFELPEMMGVRYRVAGIDGGVLVQQCDWPDIDEMIQVSERTPTQAEWEGLVFGWRVAKHVKSNAIVLTQSCHTVGIGAGQMSRVDSVRIAVAKAGERARGALLASDAFFPFPDGIEAAAAAGVTAIIQPGGSVRDDEAIAVANARGLAMVFTGMRHFRH